MYGVVLWCDNTRNRAVIWCEDHSTLAFFDDELAEGKAHTGFEPGDLIGFDLREEDDMRLAVDPYLITSQKYPSLPGDLRTASAGARREEAEPPGRPDTARYNEDRRVVVLRPHALPAMWSV